MQELFKDFKNIAKKENGNNFETINALFQLCKNTLNKKDKTRGLRYCRELKELINDLMHNDLCTDKKRIYDKIFDILCLETPYSFDSYFQALEWFRPVQEQFYLPRRNVLIKHGVIQALEDLIINDKLDEMFLSMPVRVGKTTLCVYVITWILGVASNRTNLYSSNSGINTQTFYAGVHTILSDEFTYAWHKIFPNVEFNNRTMCSAKDTYLDTGKSKRFHSFTARSIDGTLNGACDCDYLQIGDDLCSGIEEALNVGRLRSLWQKVQSDFLTRGKQTAKRLWIGTRWSIYDPIGIRLNSFDLEHDPRVRNIVIPALDENDNSNFEYLYNVGFNSEHYRKIRSSYEDSEDVASWLAIYQGEPIERSGLLFENLETYNGVLPDTKPSNIWAFCDVAWGGGDFVCMPIVYDYNGDYYCPEIVFNNGDKRITQPLIVEAIIKHNIVRAKFESNNGGDEYKEDIGRLLKDKGYPCTLVSAYASTKYDKETRVFNHAPDIKKIKFLDKEHRSIPYKKAMEQLCAFTIQGKNKHDDCPDALAEICEMINEIVKKVSFQVMERFF